MAPKIPPVKRDNESDDDYRNRIEATENKERSEQAAKEAEEAILKEAAKKAAASPAKAVERTFQKTRSIVHDLFKLKLANARKNVAYKENTLEMQNIEHVHFFHTIDSHGFEQKVSQPVAGHMHEVKIEIENGKIVKTFVGVAKKETDRKVGNGAIVKQLSSIAFGVDHRGEEQFDAHTHEIEYIKSEEIEVLI